MLLDVSMDDSYFDAFYDRITLKSITEILLSLRFYFKNHCKSVHNPQRDSCFFELDETGSVIEAKANIKLLKNTMIN